MRGLLVGEGPVLGAQGHHAIRAAQAHPGRGHRRRVHRQRRERAHQPQHAGAAGQRRRGAGPLARLPPVDGVRDACRGHAGALRVRRAGGVVSRHGRHPQEDHEPHEGPRHHQSEQPHRLALPARGAAGARRHRARARPHHLLGRDLRPHRHGRFGAYLHRLYGARRVLRHVQRPVEVAHGGGVPHRLDGAFGRQGAGARLHPGRQHAVQHAHVLERSRAVHRADGSRRPPERAELHRAGRARVRAARVRVQRA